ncbi:MAG: hypothetical protein FJ095_15935 [Deltaproteobacteria bacterium]|nr:hypothetical protein [Deltaproteobacteria bacterium]
MMVALGLRLHEGCWSLYLNEPDLDGILAAWVLLQHDRLTAHRRERLFAVVPLLRIEGHADTYGLELPDLTGLGPRRLARERRRLDRLRGAEIELRRHGMWGEVDPLLYAAAVLEALARSLIDGHLRRI